MAITIEAIYEQGVLRLSKPISLPEGSHVEIIVISPQRFEVKNPAQILSEIAALPIEGIADQDRYLTSLGEDASQK